MRRVLPVFCVLACCGSDAQTAPDGSTGETQDGAEVAEAVRTETVGADGVGETSRDQTAPETQAETAPETQAETETADDSAIAETEVAETVETFAETFNETGTETLAETADDTTTETHTETTPTRVCGNGAPESNDACDDDNLANGDGCSDQCTVTRVRSGEYGGTAILNGMLDGTAGSCTLILRGTAAPDNVHFIGRCIGGQSGGLALLTGVDLGSMAFDGGTIGFDGTTEIIPAVPNRVVNGGTQLDATTWSGGWAADAERVTVHFAGQRSTLALESTIDLVSPPPVICGDGVIEGAEACDFAAPVSGPAPRTDLCTFEPIVDGTYVGTLKIKAAGTPFPGTCSTAITALVQPGASPEISSPGECLFDFGSSSGQPASFTLSGALTSAHDAARTVSFRGCSIWTGRVPSTWAATLGRSPRRSRVRASLAGCSSRSPARSPRPPHPEQDAWRRSTTRVALAWAPEVG